MIDKTTNKFNQLVIGGVFTSLATIANAEPRDITLSFSRPDATDRCGIETPSEPDGYYAYQTDFFNPADTKIIATIPDDNSSDYSVDITIPDNSVYCYSFASFFAGGTSSRTELQCYVNNPEFEQNVYNAIGGSIDGILDLQEVQLLSTASEFNTDLDQDGLKTLEEWELGFNPLRGVTSVDEVLLDGEKKNMIDAKSYMDFESSGMDFESVRYNLWVGDIDGDGISNIEDCNVDGDGKLNYREAGSGDAMFVPN